MRRRATHSGTWYSGNAPELKALLNRFLNINVSSVQATGKALIAPFVLSKKSHRADRQLGMRDMNIVEKRLGEDMHKLIGNKCKAKHRERVFILGPAHYMELRSCGVSSCEVYETPLGELNVDVEVTRALEKTGAFVRIDKEAEEEEHSIELHLPFIYYQLSCASPRAKIVPILVGAITFEQEQLYGELLAPYIGDPKNRFVISSDFCHWGRRFAYTYYKEPGQPSRELSRSVFPSSTCPIHVSIEQCDKEGMRKIEEGEHSKFIEYLSKTRNTICGRHPISVMLCALKEAKIQEKFQFIYYAQSSQCKTISDSSVSYATAIVSY
ncbi:hypothetical protein PORY_000473 [Pneumocystis oryctolagi]|uniref:Uncharacterized protein n=1 Tax=Pneumocystis oryctolagi TaxID=42067 RepID=A0ACB7CFZ9_9ASCO|nr:hypothetical protein PORY_000473 [Pneumocystis oryctolagi]